jgi:hypothetical protein
MLLIVLPRDLVIPNVRVFHRGGGISVSTVVERQPILDLSVSVDKLLLTRLLKRNPKLN